MSSAKLYCLIGGQTLLGREIRDVASNSGLNLLSFDTADSEGDELEVSLPLDPASISSAKAVFLADADSAKKLLGMNPRHVIDLTGTLNTPEGPRFSRVPSAGALMLKLAFEKLSAFGPIARSVVNLFQPASEWGSKALHELQQQTTSLLSFKPLPKEVFDTQAAFAQLANFGEESLLKLGPIEERIARELAFPFVSLRLSHAPVFHGLTASIWIDYAAAPNWQVLENSLDATPDNVTIAGEDNVQIGGFARDPQAANAAWLWAVADNHRLVARRALAIAEALV
jgi:aspartate-semialdehyde dehydrogenase